jgi:xylulokinase
MYSLGIDLGSSSVKVTIFHYESGEVAGSAHFPPQEMAMIAEKPGWAEQDPAWWWEAFKEAYRKASKGLSAETRKIEHIGIAYQMHGLVCLDKNGKPLRPSIIWCDSRAVPIGEQALQALGPEYGFHHLLNSPGNFTAAKLAWVKQQEPQLYEKIDKICLPGDYIAFRLTGELSSTISGLSEGIFYDFKNQEISRPLLAYFGFSDDLLPPIKNSFDNHGQVKAEIAAELNLSAKAAVTYKAGDQPNNAFSLNVLEPGEFAATAGTSGVVYGVSDQLFIDTSQRVNSFAHVNYRKAHPRIGILLCINGTGIANAWAQKWTKADHYPAMNGEAQKVAKGSEGLHFFPFGNGAERMLGNTEIGSHLLGIHFNQHRPAHLYRAVQEGIVYSFIYGMEAFKENNIPISVIRAGCANMFLSPLFSQTLATLSGAPIELYDTDGALGAARGALVGGKLMDLEEVFGRLKKKSVIEPKEKDQAVYAALYKEWKRQLEQLLKK